MARTYRSRRTTVPGVKVRFGVTIGPEVGVDDLAKLGRSVEEVGFDTVWVAEVLLNRTLDPIVALSYLAAHTTKLRLGAHVIIPGRAPVHLARQLAQVDQLSHGRLLLVGVLGLPEEADRGAQGLPRSELGSDLEEVVGLMRRLWAGETVTHASARHRLDGVYLDVPPVQQPLEMWLAGSAPSALRRTGRIGDGWMPGRVTPAEATEKRKVIEDAAAAAGRTMDPEHYGANVFYGRGHVPQAAIDRFGDGIPSDSAGIRRRVEEWMAAGFSKFLLRPLLPPDDWRAELDQLAVDVDGLAVG
jgi:probable F420-dependent oxidoreductase